MSGLIQEFKNFAFKGNLLELAVAFVLGAAFAALVTTFVEAVVMPVVAAIFGKPNFDELFQVGLGDGTILFGVFLTALVTFLLIALALFLIVKAISKIMPAKATETKDCTHCLTTIPLAANTCSACGKDVVAV
jgi:large conductance mechanosensitive channel